MISAFTFMLAVAVPATAQSATAPTPAPAASSAPAAQHVSLAQALDIAVATSPVLQTARDDYRLAQVQVKLARTPQAPLLSGSVTTGQSVATQGTSALSSSAGISLQQLIYDGGKVLAQIHGAQASEVAAADTYRRAVQLLAFNVGQTYYNALQAHASVELARQIIAQDQAQENLIAAQLQAGTVTRVDLATAQVTTGQSRVLLAQTVGTEISADAAFDDVLGLNADAGVLPNADAQVNSPQMALAPKALDYGASVAQAMLLRPDYSSAQQAVEAANDLVRAARLGRAPVLTGTVSTATSLASSAGSVRNNGSIGASIVFPLYDQGVTAANTEQAEINVDLANAQLRSTELSIQVQVRQAVATLAAAQAAVQEAQANLKQAQEVLADTQEQYRAGVSNLALLLNAQTDLTQAENNRLTAIYNLRQAEQNYLFAIGNNDAAG